MKSEGINKKSDVQYVGGDTEWRAQPEPTAGPPRGGHSISDCI